MGLDLSRTEIFPTTVGMLYLNELTSANFTKKKSNLDKAGLSDLVRIQT